MVKQTSTNDTTVEDEDIEQELWLKNIKHRMECNHCEHAWYVHSEHAWYCPRQRRLTEGYCEY